MIRFSSPFSSVTAILGVGYVGLPIAYNLAKSKNSHKDNKKTNHTVIAFDIDKKRINELNNSFDRTKEIPKEEFKTLKNLSFTTDEKKLYEADVFIITVPTPVNKNNHPNLNPLKNACKTIGQTLKNRTNKKNINPIIIIESTVFPGATEEYCIPIIEEESKLLFNKDFFVGYSPERINPGDKNKKMIDIIKVTSGSNSETGNWINDFYGAIIKAGTYLAPNIKVAEAAKVIENTQRDINIALINELSIIFKKLNIDTLDVLAAANTKWNFLPFYPGLVGGHCIGVDPYYLTFKAEQIGYHPEIVLAGRRINNNMSNWIIENLILEIAKKGINICKARALFLGFTFKENCPDCRNTKIIDLIIELKKYGVKIDIVDPEANVEEVYKQYDINIKNNPSFSKKYDMVIASVAHDEFKKYEISTWKKLVSEKGIFFDIKGIIPRELNPLRI